MATPTPEYYAKKVDACDERIRELERTIAEIDKARPPPGAKSKGNKPGPAVGSPSVAAAAPPPLKYGGKVLDAEELEAAVARLTRPVRKEPTLEPIPGAKPPTTLDAEALEALVSRLGADDVERRRANTDAAAQKELDEYPLAVIQREREEKGRTVRLGPDAVAALGCRLSDASVAAKEKKVEAVRAELLREVTDHQKRQSGSVTKACVDRVYGASVERQRAVHEKVFQRYVKEPEKKKLSKDQQAAMASRLSTKA